MQQRPPAALGRAPGPASLVRRTPARRATCCRRHGTLPTCRRRQGPRQGAPRTAAPSLLLHQVTSPVTPTGHCTIRLSTFRSNCPPGGACAGPGCRPTRRSPWWLPPPPRPPPRQRERCPQTAAAVPCAPPAAATRGGLSRGGSLGGARVGVRSARLALGCAVPGSRWGAQCQPPCGQA